LKSLWFSYAVGLVFNLILNMLLIIVPLYAALLGTTPLFIGLAVSLPAFVMVLLRIPGGLLSDRIGSRRVALLALAAMCVAAALLAQAGNIWLIMVSQLFSGFARGVFWPSIQSYVSKLQVFTIGQRLGWFTGATSIGGVAGPVLGGVMVAVAGYRSAFVLLAVLSAVALVLILGLEDPVTARAGSTGVTGIVEDISSLIRNPNVYRTGLAAFLAAVPLATASSFYPLYVKWIGQPPEIIGTLSSFRTVMVGLGALAFGTGHGSKWYILEPIAARDAHCTWGSHAGLLYRGRVLLVGDSCLDIDSSRICMVGSRSLNATSACRVTAAR